MINSNSKKKYLENGEKYATIEYIKEKIEIYLQKRKIVLSESEFNA